MKALFALGLLALLPSCPPSPTPPAPPEAGADASLIVPDAAPLVDAAPVAVDAGPSTPCSRACANMAALGCSEGTALNCASTCEKAQSTRIIDMKPDCLASAKDKAAVRACTSSVKCP